MKKLRQGEVKFLFQSHTAVEEQSWNLNPGQLEPDMVPCPYFMLSTQEPHEERQVDRITLPHASIAISVK